MEIISVEAWRGAVEGTMIMVATRRKLANERPSIISLIGDDLIGAGGQLSVDALNAERMPEMNCFPSRARGHSPASLRTD
jgi:hypothetical protein